MRDTIVLLAVLCAVPAAAQDMIDAHSMIVHKGPPDIADWPRTETITTVQDDPTDGLAIGFDPVLPESWKWPSNPANPSENFQYTVWYVVRSGGQWNAAPFVQMWQGRPFTKGALPPFLTGYVVLWGAQGSVDAGVFGDYVPAVGDTVGIFVSAGNARNVTREASVRERSNIVTFQIPAGDRGVFPFMTTPPPPDPGGPPAPPPGPIFTPETYAKAVHAELLGEIQALKDAINAPAWYTRLAKFLATDPRALVVETGLVTFFTTRKAMQ